MSTCITTRIKPRNRAPYVPQRERIMNYLKLYPGSTISDLHRELRIPYDSARTVVDKLIKDGRIAKGGKGPLSALPFYVASIAS